ncbi:MAG: Ig-like domain-containing protein [Rhizobiaceae bacterium]
MNKFRALLIGFAAAVGAGGIAAYNGVFDGPPPPAETVKAPAAVEAPKAEAPAADAAKPDAAKIEAPKPEPAPAAEIAKVDPGAAEPAAPADSPVGTDKAPAASVTEPAAIAAPTFDVLRVEPDGSVLIAGKASENAQVEVLSGADILGSTKAEANGDFAITLSNPLKPGDYQLVLRMTGTDGKSANSAETATVSVPEQKNGPVLALVEEAGKPSRIITTPEKPVETAQAAIAEAKPAASAEVQVSGEVKAPEAPVPAATESVTIEAVEIENGKIFVAGAAKGVDTVRIYANDEVLGDARRGQGDRFLAEFQRELAPGDYIFKAEGLAADGVTVLSRASVPFQRQADVAELAPAPAANEGAAAAEAETNAAPAETPKPKAVIIRRGDTLWQISRRIYGRGVRYSTIYLANQGVTGNPNMIFPGQVFTVPDKTPEGDAANPAEVEKRAAPLAPAEQ